ncbi:MAG: murein hydrolase activator EnvC family protein [Candidatus Limnocylindria bacterium]
MTSPRPYAPGWSSRPRRSIRGAVRRRLPAFAMLLVLATALTGGPAGVPGAQADELADAKARQAQLKREVAAQKERVAALSSLQSALSSEIRETRAQLSAVGADLDAVRARITAMEARIVEVRAAYAELVTQLRAMDANLRVVEAQEQAKRKDLADRRALLASRIRDAYDTDRTSPLETFLSGGTFTDLLAEMSYYIDVGEQDKALAGQIDRDAATLAALRDTVALARERTDALRVETAAQKRELDRSLVALEETQAELKALERRVASALAEQKRQYAALQRNKADAARLIREAAAKQQALARRIDDLIAAQVRKGNVPSEYNGTFRWPMDSFDISGEYGCSSFSWYAPGNGCANYHNGIDMVAPYGTPVRAAGDGTVVYVGWNWADGSDPAWIVVIAHSSNLRTWYAHMQPKRPVAVGQAVSKGTIIGYEGSTGRSTGAHLHWAVELNGTFTNPRLFL